MKGFFRKVVAAVAVLAIVLGVMTVAPLAASADIAMKLSDTSRVQGEEITVTVYFPKSYNKVSSLDMSLVYDSSKLEFVSMKQGKELRKARDKQTNGEVYSEYAETPGTVNWALAGGNNYEFTGTFSTVVFAVRNFADHGKCSVSLKINHASNSGFVNMTDQITTSGASFDIYRNSMNDMEFRLNDTKDGYIIRAYNCAVYDNVIISDTYKGLPVVGIDYAAFMNHAEIKSLTLPSSLKSIGMQSFYGCSGLSTLVIPENVTSIGDGAFKKCDGLKSVSFNPGLEEIGAEVFSGCPFLTSVELPFTLTSLGANAFLNCTLLNTVKISKNTSIGTNAFKGCSDSMKFISVSGNAKLEQYIKSSGIQATTEIVKDISLGKVKAIDAQQFTGNPVIPDTSVTVLGIVRLAANKDYKVIGRNNTNIGKATAYIVGIDGYGEGIEVSFDIVCKHPNATRTTVKEANCTNAGSVKVTCSLCGDEHDEVIPAKGHTPSESWVIQKRPTISATGTKYMVCSVCKVKIKTETMPKVYPDINGDGRINSADALIVLRYSVDLDSEIKTEDQFINADTNGDGAVNSADALTILRIAVGAVTL